MGRDAAESAEKPKGCLVKNNATGYDVRSPGNDESGGGEGTPAGPQGEAGEGNQGGGAGESRASAEKGPEQAGGGCLGGNRARRKSDRDLIEDALQQASPRGEGAGGEGAGVAADSFAGYEILREIHRGGQGVVYQALQRTTRRKVAIKLIHGGPFTGAWGRARFEREVQILGQLDHPNIVGILDSGVAKDGSYYYVMDYISGRSLDEVLRESKNGGKLRESIGLFIKICEAVNAAHLRGVIHRDIKPANVRIDANGEPVVVDFGLAKIVAGEGGGEPGSDQRMTVTGQFIGSLPWASPEQAQGTPGAIDVRTDVYSLGVMLYQMLTGTFPYAVVGNMRDVLDNILRAKPSRPSSIRRQINNEVETIILKCLSKERERRYQNAGELARDLRHYLNGEPIEAKRDSGLYVIGKTLSRYKVAAGTGALFLVVVVGFAVAMSLLYRVARADRASAVVATGEARVALENETRERRRADENAKVVFEFATTTTLAAADQISIVQGGTPALKALVAGSLAKLKALEPQISTEPRMMRTLAHAYHRLSLYQSDLYDGREGDEVDAIANHERAAAIRKSLLDGNSNSWTAQYDYAQSVQRSAMLLQAKRDYVGARSGLAGAVGGYLKAIALAAKAPAESRAELDACRRSLLAAKRAYVYTYLRLAEDAPTRTAGEVEAAMKLVEEARAAYGLYGADLDELGKSGAFATLVVRSRGILRDEESKLLVIEAGIKGAAAELAKAGGSDAKAREALRGAFALLEDADAKAAEAQKIFKQLKTADSQGAEGDHDLFVSLHTQGEAVAKRASLRDVAIDKCGFTEQEKDRGGDHRAALELFQSALAHAERARSSDPSRLRYTRSEAVAHLKVAKQMQALGRFVEAQGHADRSVELRRELARYDSVARHRRDLGAGLFKAAEIARTRGDAAKDATERQEAWARAEVMIAETRRVFERLAEEKIIAAGSGEVRTTLGEQATLWMNMGIDAAGRGEKEQARSLYHQALSNLAGWDDGPLAWPWQATRGKIESAMEGL